MELTTVDKGTPYEKDVTTDLVRIDQQGCWGRVARSKDGICIETAPQMLDESVPEADEDEWGYPEMWADDMVLDFDTVPDAHDALNQVASGEIKISYF